MTKRENSLRQLQLQVQRKRKVLQVLHLFDVNDQNKL